MTIIIDSISYDVPIIGLDETCEFLDKFAERSIDGTLHRELIGTYHNQVLIFGNPQTTAERTAFATLWAKLTEATEFHTVTVPDSDGVPFTFSAYFSGISRSLRFWDDNKTAWKGLTVKFTAQSPKATP